MADAAQTLLLHKVVHDAPSRVRVGPDGVLIHVVHEVEVKVLHATLFQLFLKNGGGVVGIAELVAGVLGGEVIAFPGIGRQGPAQHHLGHAAVVGVGGVEVVDAVLHGIAHHLRCQVLVDGAVRQHRQAHGAEAQAGQLQSLKVTIDHGRPPLSR